LRTAFPNAGVASLQQLSYIMALRQFRLFFAPGPKLEPRDWEGALSALVTALVLRTPAVLQWSIDGSAQILSRSHFGSPFSAMYLSTLPIYSECRAPASSAGVAITTATGTSSLPASTCVVDHGFFNLTERTTSCSWSTKRHTCTFVRSKSG
jgi:hypothetical protein